MVLSGNDGSMLMVGMILVRRKPKNQIFYVGGELCGGFL
mgnify:CR=1 FL=1